MMKGRWFGIILCAVSIAALVVSGVTTAQRYSFNKCQAATNKILIQSLDAQSNAAKQDRDALDRMVLSFLALKPGQGTQGRQILEDYVNARREADAERAAHPLPRANTCD